jgi:hypothetical protein
VTTYSFVSGNRLTYKINDKDPEMLALFEINPDTGLIKTKRSFVQEKREVHTLTVIAEDGAPSSRLRNGKANQKPNKLRIVNKDKNDKPLSFPQQHYTSEDLDTGANVPTYSIVDGNLSFTFVIEPQTGFIKVNKPLDYKNITYYLNPKWTEASSHFSINKEDGSLRIVEMLDRDRPFGFPARKMYGFAQDVNGPPFKFSRDREGPQETQRRFVARDDLRRHVYSNQQQMFAGQTVVIKEDLSLHGGI